MSVYTVTQDGKRKACKQASRQASRKKRVAVCFVVKLKQVSTLDTRPPVALGVFVV